MTKQRLIRVVSATEAKNRFGAIIKRAYAGDEHLIIERDGIPVVAIVPIQDYERLLAGEELAPEVKEGVGQSSRAASSRARLRAVLAETGPQMPSVAQEDVERDIQQAIETVRQQA